MQSYFLPSSTPVTSVLSILPTDYRTALSKIEPQKKEQPVSKPKLSDNPDHLEWGPSRDKKKYIIGSGAKSYSKAFQSSLPQEER